MLENLCKLYGKVFDSVRALFGHMRHHSGKLIKKDCKECGEEFELLRPLTDHTKTLPERYKIYGPEASYGEPI